MRPVHGSARHSNQTGVCNASSFEDDVRVIQRDFPVRSLDARRQPGAQTALPQSRCDRRQPDCSACARTSVTAHQRRRSLRRHSQRHLPRIRWSEQFRSSPTNSPPSRWCRTTSYAATAAQRSAIFCSKSPAYRFELCARGIEPTDHPRARCRTGAHPGEWQRAPTALPISAKTTSCRSIPLTSDKVEVMRGPATSAVRLAGDRWRGRVDQQPHPDLHPRPRHQRGVSRRRERPSTTGSTARRCSTLAAETSQSMPTPSAARHRTIAYRAIPICRRPIRRTLRTRRSPAISTVGSRIPRAQQQRRGRGRVLHFQRGLLRPRASRKTMRSITFRESTAKTTTPASMRTRRSS